LQPWFYSIFYKKNQNLVRGMETTTHHAIPIFYRSNCMSLPTKE